MRPFLKKDPLWPWRTSGTIGHYQSLAFVSKVLEKVVAAQLTSHMNAHFVLYRCHNSPETAMMKVGLYIITSSEQWMMLVGSF